MSKKKPSNVVDFPCPEPEAVESRAPKKKKGKVLEIVPKVIRDEEIRELVELREQMESAVEKYLQKDRWIGAALLAGAVVEGDKERTEMVRAFVMTYKKSKPKAGPLEGIKLAVLQNL
jgi:hypothetical protein